ncbi:hypothetical protein PR202_ga14664 [Eleusine coracana subsp. coracana]|uniref:BTB domain-containing protein n=1 Tax=Eleusine coracana subsp. coracana TaxID=191504 RepID=A0AAV5CHZ6_ELECO|nr:hypothetical protein PR202_ga14664 [Eleusine coracana subsp. coracana]
MGSSPTLGTGTLQRLSNDLEETTISVQQFKIRGLPEKAAYSIGPTRWRAGEHDMDVQFCVLFPSERHHNPGIMTRIDLATDASVAEASFTCRVLDQTGQFSPWSAKEIATPGKQGHAQDMLVMYGAVPCHPGCDSVIVECEITVQHRRTMKGTDVTFLVSGERITAHKCVLAARSPVFMAELFGDMKENAALEIKIEDMEADVFRALIKFIYTDTLPELVDSQEDQDTKKAIMAQHLLATADRYGMERLKRVREDRICGDISVSTATTTLVLAEQHGCSKLKAKCMEFIVANLADVEAITATDGYKRKAAPRLHRSFSWLL